MLETARLGISVGLSFLPKEVVKDVMTGERTSQARYRRKADTIRRAAG